MLLWDFPLLPRGWNIRPSCSRPVFRTLTLRLTTATAPCTVKGGKVEQCAMYLYADRPYAGGAFFKYAKVAFVPDGPDMKAKRDANGKLIVYGMEDIEDFAQRVGRIPIRPPIRKKS